MRNELTAVQKAMNEKRKTIKRIFELNEKKVPSMALDGRWELRSCGGCHD